MTVLIVQGIGYWAGVRAIHHQQLRRRRDRPERPSQLVRCSHTPTRSLSADCQAMGLRDVCDTPPYLAFTNHHHLDVVTTSSQAVDEAWRISLIRAVRRNRRNRVFGVD